MVSGSLGENCRVERALELLTVWVLSASAIGLVSTLAGRFMALQVCLLAALITCAYAWRVNKTDRSSSVSVDWRHLVLLTLLCLFFRLPAYHYILGGQDEGVYVNMAQHIVDTGGISAQDIPLGKLDDNPSLKNTYLQDNRGPINYLPGIYVSDQTSPNLQFQFYHLFPVWMAIFAGLFGAKFGVYALTFFGWLSIVFIYKLALAISCSRRVGLVAGLLLALSPLHVFFSKFPVTEVPTLAFSLMAFAYLVQFRNSGEGVRSTRLLWLSGLSFGALFFTRISGFMYMPFIVALAVASAVADSDREMRRSVFLWAFGVVGIYALSVWYGIHWSNHYSKDIYHLSFARAFGRFPQAGPIVSVGLMLGMWFGVLAMSRNERFRLLFSSRVIATLRRLAGVVVLFALIMGIFKIYQLGWTDRYLHDRWLGSTWHLAHARWLSVRASSFYALFIYLAFIFPLSIYFVVAGRRDNPNIEFLRLFVAGFLVYISLLKWNVPYGPYYARYLLSEVVPYLSLLFVLVWAGLRPGFWKKSVTWLLIFSMSYMVYASVAQLGKSSNDKLYASLKQLLEPVDSSDLLLMTDLQPGWPADSQIKTSIVYTFGRNVVTVSDKSLNDHAYIAAWDSRYDDVYLLSTSSVVPEEFTSVGSTKVGIWSYKRSYSYPHKFGLHAEKRLYLFRMTRSVFPMEQVQDLNATGPWSGFFAAGWNAPEGWGTWSQGKHAEFRIDSRDLPSGAGDLRLHFEANVLVNQKHTHQHIGVRINGLKAVERDVTYPSTTTSFDVEVPASLRASGEELRIEFDLPDAVAPRAIGMGADDRVLALGLKSLEIFGQSTKGEAAPADK